MREHARLRRKNQTPAENRMWYFLRNRKLNGYKFVREYAIDNYIADFACREKKLVIEIDGAQHLAKIEYDKLRTTHLMSLGYQVLRFGNHEVFTDISSVLNRIVMALESRP